jgi:hypothetical protein
MADEHSSADTTAIANEMNRRPSREPERHTFIWLDHQKYHADDQTIALLWQIKGWDRSPDQAVAHFAFDHAKQHGQVLDGPVSHHELAAHHHAQRADPTRVVLADRVVAWSSDDSRAHSRVQDHSIDPSHSSNEAD